MTRRKHKTPKHEQPPPAASQPSRSCDDSFRPWLLAAMTALLVARPLFPSEAAASNGDGLSMVMLWIALAVFWLFAAVRSQTNTIRFGWTDAAVLLFVGWVVVAAIWAVYHGTPRPAVNMLWEWISLGLCFFLARQLIVTSRERRAVVAVMIALAVAISAYGLYQRWYEMPQTRAFYRANPDQAMRESGVWLPPASPERKLFEDRLENTEPMATFALTNSLAVFLTPWLVMLIGVIGGSLHDRKRLLKLLACLVPIAVCLLLTKSRSGYAAVCVGAFCVWYFSRERRIRIGWRLPTALAGIAAIVLSATLVVEGPSVFGRALKSFGYRVQYWQSSLAMIADHPWIGCGPGNFQAAYTQYKLPEASEEIADPHNFLLEIWSTAGTPAMLAFLAVLACCAFADRRQGAENSGQWPVVSGQERGERGEGREELNLQFSKSPNSNTQSLIPNPFSDAWPHILGGGVAGALLAAPISMVSAVPLGIAALLLGLPLAVATVALMFGWIQEGRLPQWLPGVCIAALLVNLLAAGGIALPSIAGTFWLLLALTLDDRQPRALRPSTAWAMLIACMALFLACGATAYRPVLGCQAELRLAEHNQALARTHLEAAAAADPLSADPWRQLAAVELEAWCQKPDAAAFARFTTARDKTLELAPNVAATWSAAGDWTLRAYSKTDKHGRRIEPNAVRAAIDLYARAAQLYPNNATIRAKLAEAHLAAGDRSAFRREAEMALWLDKTTPHADKKLPDALRERLVSGLAEEKPK